MPRTPTALITPELITWARESYGFNVSSAAKKIGVTKERLAAWENGDERPTVAQARKMSSVYKRPLAVFFLSTPPKDFQTLRDFRLLEDFETPPIQSPELKREIQRAIEIRDAALDLIGEEEEINQFLKIHVSLSESPEPLALKIREKLEIGTEAQISWRDLYEALRAWRNSVEQKGVLITQARGISVDEMRGFSVADSTLPMIVINAKDSPSGRVFTLIHELIHILLNQSGICEWTKTDHLHPDERRIEVFCNHVAGAILVPRELLLNHELVRQKPHKTDWSDDELRILSNTFSVSREVILRRLLIIGRTTEDFYKQKRREFLKEYEAIRSKSTAPIVSYEKRVVNSLGSNYIQLVLGSYYEKRITLSSVSDLLGVRIRNIPKIEYELLGWSHVQGGGM